MTRDDVTRMAREAGFLPQANPVMPQLLERFAALVASAERERIKQANAPEIERINSYIKKLEDAVKAEREACAKVCDDRCGWTPRMIGSTIRARGNVTTNDTSQERVDETTKQRHD